LVTTDKTDARRYRRAAPIVLLVFVIGAGAFLARASVLSMMGDHLVRADRLVNADAIVVLAGGTPQREIEAADLYVAGYAPRVVMTIERDAPAADVLRARGVPFETQIELKRRILRSLGVPDSALTFLERTRATSTRMETDLIKEWTSSKRARRIIIVTSPYHTARAGLVFSRALRSQKVEVMTRPASHEPFDVDNWWNDREQLRNGFFEWQKLLFYYLAYW
jgi:uncharacterized SAM-binding protein YcdF (DUF218 family)